MRMQLLPLEQFGEHVEVSTLDHRVPDTSTINLGHRDWQLHKMPLWLCLTV